MCDKPCSCQRLLVIYHKLAMARTNMLLGPGSWILSLRCLLRFMDWEGGYDSSAQLVVDVKYRHHFPRVESNKRKPRPNARWNLIFFATAVGCFGRRASKKSLRDGF